MYRASKKEFSTSYLFEEQGISEGSNDFILIINESEWPLSGLVLARVPRVPGIRGIFGHYCLAPADFGNFTK